MKNVLKTFKNIPSKYEIDENSVPLDNSKILRKHNDF